jgi:hypothetical protein
MKDNNGTQFMVLVGDFMTFLVLVWLLTILTL